MIDYQPIQSITIGGLNLKVWGLLFAIAVFVGLAWTYQRAQKEEERNHILNLGIIILILGVVGSRLAHIILYSNQYDSVSQIFKVWQGGMVSYGGFILAIFGSLVYLKRKKLNIYKYTDLFAPPLALSIAITRVGCFLNHCHLGKECNLFWGLDYLGDVRHPIALYYALSALIILVILLIIKRKNKKPGLLTLTLATLYPLFRLTADRFAFYQPKYIATVNNIFLLASGIFFAYLLIKKLND